MNTLLLDRTTWDLLPDASGNMAVATGSYAICQNVASAIRVFAGECYYNTGIGLPYRQHILARTQAAPVFRLQAEQAASAVAGVAAARCVLTGLGANRQLSGAIVVSTTSGDVQHVGF
ncbi:MULTISPECIES: hypothetical protein [Acetobacter]|uniref:Uncharacterized protein n=1 Tax=Acetobacter syzygii TaxID=146476 RepID=A0A270BKV5_9PROT|nr:hypothetical protein [Acetobacter syzygii]NSL91392.1 hypothetical protein [Acetobacter syzygii]PAL24766.1 hypothetical protein B9K05_08695 [Acetobacter syzygii]PAL24880.1 hypothetical protein B9K04_08185 [Acetobacter syzygii]GAN70682.1 hypothetical protein Absy_008_195 [Acetobacter syzygii]GBR65575.1 hypothetical protein AA0483_1914 [Acetobacter syzygii NRIC 0483]